MATRRRSHNADPLGIEVVLRGVRPQPAYGCLAVVDLSGPDRLVTQPVPDRHARVLTTLDERPHLSIAAPFVSFVPAAAVNVDHDRQRLVAGALGRQIEVQPLTR